MIKLNFVKNYILKLYIIIFIANFLETLGISLIPILFSSIFAKEKLINKNSTLEFFSKFDSLNLNELQIVLIIFLLFIFKNLILIGTNYFRLNILYKIKIKIADLLYDAYLKSNLITLQSKNSSEISRNFMTESNQAAHFYINFSYIFQEVTLIIFLFFILAAVNLKLTFVVLTLVILFILFINFFIIKKIKYYASESIKSRFYFLNSIKQNLESIKEIKIFGKYSFFKKIFTNSFNNNEKNSIKNNFVQEIPRNILEILFITIICLFLFMVINFNILNEIHLGEVILLGVIAVRLIPSFNKINHYVHLYYQFKVSRDQVFNDIEKFYRTDKKNLNINDTLEFDKNLNFISLKNACFDYKTFDQPNNKFKLENINLKFYKNKINSLVGPSGSGKSTIINLISGLLPLKSGNYIINNQEYKTLPLNIKKHISYLPQQIYLLDDTIINNIAFGENEKDINIKKIKKILFLVGLNKVVENFPKKLKTKIGERGNILSGGQLQRIGIARSLYFDKKIMILDEPTSSLDLKNSQQILKVLKKIKKNRIVIIVTHSLLFAKASDNSYFVEKGIVKKIK